MKETDALYDSIEKDVEKELRQLYRERYEELMMFLEATLPKADIIDDLVAMYIMGLLNEVHPVTKYIFTAELKRKRDRAKEAIVSVPTVTQKQLEVEKAGRIALQQIKWYTDFTSQDAEIQAYKDAGVKRVRRHEMKDDKVCAICRKLDGEIYNIDKIPPLPHINCRVWYEPII